MFRFPVLWNYIQPIRRGPLDTRIIQTLDNLIKYVTDKNMYAILDIHNYARLNGIIIGQNKNKNPPYNYDLGDLWVKLATHYATNTYVHVLWMFGLMNEPYDLNIFQWGQTVQYVINQIRRNTTATTQYILVPGTDWQGITNWVSDSWPGIGNLTDTSSRLLFDVHKYFDGSGGGSGHCSDFDLANFQNFADKIRQMKARAILTETGGNATTDSNQTLNNELKFLEDNSDTFMGWTIWGAGLDKTEPTYLDALNWNVSLENQKINIVRDVVIPHMQTRNLAPSKGLGTRNSFNIVIAIVYIAVLILKELI